MRTLNSKDPAYSVGKRVIVKKKFSSSGFSMDIGEIGKIIGISIDSFPDFGLFDIKILKIDFLNKIIFVGEDIAKEHTKVF